MIIIYDQKKTYNELIKLTPKYDEYDETQYPKNYLVNISDIYESINFQCKHNSFINYEKDKFMTASQHLLARMSQRSIRKTELDPVMAFGEVIGDKVILNKQTAKERLEELKFLLSIKKGHSKCN